MDQIKEGRMSIRTKYPSQVRYALKDEVVIRDGYPYEGCRAKIVSGDVKRQRFTLYIYKYRTRCSWYTPTKMRKHE